MGSGLYGAVFAQQAATKGKKVLMIDKRPNIAGNVYTEDIEEIHVHKYGAHIFHANNKSMELYPQSLRNLIVSIHQLQTIRENYILFRLICIHSIRCGGVIAPQEAADKIKQQKKEAGITEPKELRRTGNQSGRNEYLRKTDQRIYRKTMGKTMYRTSFLYYQKTSSTSDI